MEEIQVSSVEELALVLSTMPDGSLFRGQNKNYKNRQGYPSLITSFDRLGCIPQVMLQWSHYARFILAPFIEDESKLGSLEFIQAVLQHYGWRSFYLDASTNPAVSSWFASNTYSAKRSIEMIEDCHEQHVWRVRQTASYSPYQGVCHLFVLDPVEIRRLGISCHNLASIEITPNSARFHRQEAWLIGHLSAALPREAIRMHISGPSEVFRDYAVENGFVSTDDLFPNDKRDPVLRALLSLPWRRRHLPKDGSEVDIPVFERVLDIPEYHHETQRWLKPEVALFDDFSIRQSLQLVDSSFHEALVQSVPSGVYFGRSDYEPRPMPLLTDALNKYPAVIVEVDDLIRFPDMGESYTYGKGIFVAKQDEVFMVSDLVVDHPGTLITGFGVNAGWYYQNTDEGWKRINHVDDCPCGNVLRHRHHMSVLYRFEEMLRSADLSR